jgi:hypothetical protein
MASEANHAHFIDVADVPDAVWAQATSGAIVPVPPSSSSESPSSGGRSLKRMLTEGKLLHTENGLPYLCWERFNKEPVADARLPLMAPLLEIEDRFGVGNRVYFNTLLFSLAVNMLLFGVGLVEWIFYVVYPSRVAINGQFEWKDFFVSEYIRPAQV